MVWKASSQISQASANPTHPSPITSIGWRQDVGGAWGPEPCPSICCDAALPGRFFWELSLAWACAFGAVFNNDPLRLSGIFRIGGGTSGPSLQGRRWTEELALWSELPFWVTQWRIQLHLDRQARAARPPWDTHRGCRQLLRLEPELPCPCCPSMATLGSHFAQDHHILVRNMRRSGDGKGGCSALLLSGLTLSFDLYLLIFLHPMPCPLAYVLGIAHLQMMEGFVS